MNCANDDAEWIRSIRDVVDKDSKNPVTREFLQNPTRHNYKRWMKTEGVRHMEPGEKARNRKNFDLQRHTDRVMQKHQQRNRVEI